MERNRFSHEILIKYFNPVAKRTEKLDLKLRGRITIILGNSGTGKTYTAEGIADMKRSRNIQSNTNLDDIIPITLGIQFTSEGNMMDYLKSLSDKIIIIDEADSRLHDMKNVKQFIEQDMKNLYILMYRSIKSSSLGATPANIATLKFNEDTFSLNYKYDVGGW